MRLPGGVGGGAALLIGITIVIRDDQTTTRLPYFSTSSL